jgi:hypothetical protein
MTARLRQNSYFFLLPGFRTGTVSVTVVLGRRVASFGGTNWPVLASRTTFFGITPPSRFDELELMFERSRFDRPTQVCLRILSKASKLDVLDAIAAV